MKDIKTVSISAASGFILSLIFGLFSGSSFGKVFLTALVAAVIFAVLGFIISIVNEKFLAVESSEVDSPSPSVSSDNTTSTVGNNVDIVIEDQELERSESSNRYNVGDKFSMLNESDVVNTSSNSVSQNTTESNPGFVPVRNLESLTNFSGSEAVKPVDMGLKTVKTGNGDELDVLPDFSDVASKDTPVPQSSSEDDSFDGGFSDVSSVSTYTRKNEVDTEKFQNTELIAKAISSVLSDEE